MVEDVGVGLDALEHEVRVERHFAVEQRLADHVRGERPRLLDHLDAFAALHELGPVVHLCADGGQEVGDVLPEHVRVERRLLRHADLLPERAVVRDHRLAEDRLQPVEVLHVGVHLGDKDVLEVVGVAEKDDALVAEIDGEDRPVALRHGHDRPHRVLRVALEQRGQLEPDARFLAELVGVRGGCRLGLLHVGLGPLLRAGETAADWGELERWLIIALPIKKTRLADTRSKPCFPTRLSDYHRGSGVSRARGHSVPANQLFGGRNRGGENSGAAWLTLGPRMTRPFSRRASPAATSASACG